MEFENELTLFVENMNVISSVNVFNSNPTPKKKSPPYIPDLSSRLDLQLNDITLDVNRWLSANNNRLQHMHLVQTFSSINNSKLYLNGVLMGSTKFRSFGWFCDSINYLGFANNNTLSDGYVNFNGQIDEFRIWSGAFLPQQVKDNYIAGPGY